MSFVRSAVAALVLGATCLAATPGRAGVLFQSTGSTAGWTSVGIQHKGKVEPVPSPTYRGPTALRMEQTFEGQSGYHSEVRLHEAQGPAGSDVYYGMALYLPPNWVYHPQNVTFQQWARGDVFASPWVLMFVENDEIRVGGSGGVRGVIAKITGRHGTWIRVVTHIRHHPTNGLFEVWVDGTKGFSQSGDVSPAPGAPIRWSVGMYCTRWREEQPRGLNPMVLFHDHQRVATTYDEADPAGWSDGDGNTPPRDAGSPDVRPADDAQAVGDAGHGPEAPTPDAGSGGASGAGAGGSGPSGGGGAGTGGAGDGGARVGSGGARPAPRPRDAAVAVKDAEDHAPDEPSAAGCGCRVRGRSTPTPLAGLALLALVGGIRRARRRSDS